MDMSQSRLYRLAKRLSLGRLLRYLDLWARFGWRRGQSALSTHLRREAATEISSIAAALGPRGPDNREAPHRGLMVPLDLANAKLHRALLASVAAACPDLSVTPEILDCLSRLRSTDDLSGCVDAMVEQGTVPQTVNTALYILLLKRLLAPSELLMIASRHPRHALIAIRSGDEYRKQGRRVLAS
jgi:hypothetical protein